MLIRACRPNIVKLHIGKFWGLPNTICMPAIEAPHLYQYLNINQSLTQKTKVQNVKQILKFHFSPNIHLFHISFFHISVKFCLYREGFRKMSSIWSTWRINFEKFCSIFLNLCSTVVLWGEPSTSTFCPKYLVYFSKCTWLMHLLKLYFCDTFPQERPFGTFPINHPFW